MSLLREIEPIKTRDYLKEKFRTYYKNAEITLPPRFSSREWGFLNWGGRGMNRHINFRTQKEIKNYLSKNAPAHSYHSVAYYENSGKKTMIEKIWNGADLIFDLDADHLPEMQDVISRKITFAQLMDYIKEQTSRLVNDVLLGDFGLNEKDLLIVFSGGRGYHVHVRDKRILNLPSGARREIADYLTTSGINEKLILNDEGYINRKYGEKNKFYQEKYTLPSKEAPGWKGLVSNKIHYEIEKILKLNEEEWKGWKELIRISEENAKKIKNRRTVKDTFDNLKPNYKTRIVRKALKETQVFPDEPVTGDIHRLIRLPGSLHGKTGLIVKTLSKKELDAFDPYEMPIAFGTKPIKIRSTFQTREGNGEKKMGNNFRLKEGEITELPEFAAIYFMAMKFATLCLET